MPQTRVKICGVKSLPDARAAAEAGADAVGMILWAPGARRLIDLNTARDIATNLPPFVTTVGVFVDAPATFLRQALAHVSPGVVQMHGKEKPADARPLQPTPVVKKFTAGPDMSDQVAPWRGTPIPNLIAYLVDSPGGGTGQVADLDAAKAWIASQDAGMLPPLIVAGGLTPESVGDVIRRLRPWAVDVSTGVEDEQGNKCPRRMQAFMDAVRAADA